MTNDEYYAYVRAWKERFELQDKNRKLLARRARRDAKAIAKMLYRDFSVSTVYLFGSALDDMRFRETSDIDLAVLGLAVERYWDSLRAIENITVFPCDLIMLENASSRLKHRVYTKGVLLHDPRSKSSVLTES